MTEHAKLSPSSSHRWMNCPGSVKVEQNYENTTSIHAEEGTFAHEISEWCLNNLKDAAEAKEAFLIKDEEMVEYVQEYLDYINGLLNNNTELLVEARLNLTHWIPGGFGTADAIIYDHKTRTLHIVDLKYGKGILVDAYKNSQLLIYALGAIKLFNKAKIIHMHIVQPRKNNFSEYVLNKKELLNFGMKVADAADLALSENAPLIPGEKQCQWCKHKTNCLKLYEFTHEIICSTFDNLTPADPLSLDQNQKRLVLDNESLIIAFINAIKKEASNELMAGNPWPGYKLVEGRSNSKWNDNAEEALVELLKDNAYNKKLIGITEAKKLVGKDFVTEHTYKPPGSLTIAKESDKRPGVVTNAITLFNIEK